MALKLLIIHDDDLFQRHLSERIRLANYLVVEAHSEAEATDIIQRTAFDVVLLCVVESYQKSLALLKRIKETQPYTEVILLTPLEGHSLYDSIQAMELGAFDDILVPLDINALHSRIHEACQRQKQRVMTKRSMIGEERESCKAG